MKKVAKKQAVKVVESSSEREESEESGEDAPVMQRASLSQVVERDVGATEDGNVECVTGEQLVLQNRAAYIEWFVDLSDMSRPAIEWAGTEIPTVVLEYPGTSATERVALLKPRVEGDEYDPIGDVVSVIRLVLDLYLTPAQSYSLFSHVPSTNSFASFLSAPPSRSATPSTPTDSSTVSAPLPSLIRTLEKAKAKKDGPGFLAAVERYNVGMRTLKAEGKVVENIKAMKSVQEKLWQKVVAQVYERAVGPEIEKLREYEAFSDNVYGELLPRFIADICQRTKVGPDSVFVDLGSGVGNCVVQAALATGCEAWGFENMAHASQLARLQVVEATARFRMWGLKGGAMHVVETDFCEAPEVVELLRRTDVVLVNNEVFSSGLNHRLSLLFLDLPSLASIVSLKAFASSFTLSAHNCLSPLAILDQGTEQSYPRKSVSWKDDGGSFWIAKVDRTKLENWTKKQVEREEKMKAAAVGDS